MIKKRSHAFSRLRTVPHGELRFSDHIEGARYLDMKCSSSIRPQAKLFRRF